MVFTLEQAVDIKAEVESGSGRYINPSKIDGEIRVRLFGEGITGYEGWTNDNKPLRWQQKPSEYPDDIRKNEDGRDPVRRFIAAIAWDYEAEEFKVLSMTQKTLIKRVMELIADEDWGDCTEYDLKIGRKGEKLNTEYTITPAAKGKAAPKAAIAAYQDLDVDLTLMYDGEDPFKGADKVAA